MKSWKEKNSILRAKAKRRRGEQSQRTEQVKEQKKSHFFVQCPPIEKMSKAEETRTITWCLLSAGAATALPHIALSTWLSLFSLLVVARVVAKYLP